MDNSPQDRTLATIFQTEPAGTIVSAILLFSIGMTAILLRTHLRLPLNIPGRQGILVMMLFMAGRSMSNRNIASMFSAMGASVILLFPFIGPNDPWLPLIYLGMGFFLDYLHYLGRRWSTRNSYLFFILVGGLSYMIIPLSRICIHGLTGFPYTEFIKHGYMIPIISHFIFGAAGSLLGSAPVISYRRRSRD